MTKIQSSSLKHRAYSQELPKWLDTFDWDFFCTFTTKYTLTVKSGRRLMGRLHDRWQTENRTQSRLFWAAEPFDCKEGYHLHALFGYDNPKGEDWSKQKTDGVSLDFALLRYGWGAVSGKGNASYLSRYQKGKGANHYLAKYITKELADWDFLGK